MKRFDPLRAALLVAALSAASPAMAQSQSEARLQELQAMLEAQQQVIDGLKEQVEALRREVQKPAPAAVEPYKLPDPPTREVRSLPAGCTFGGAVADDAALSRALADPNAFFRLCSAKPPAQIADGSDKTAVALGKAVGTALPGRALLPPGLVPQITFDKSTSASLSLGIPFRLRNCYSTGSLCSEGGEFKGFAPRTFTVSVSVSTALASGEGKLLALGRDSELDITGKTQATFGFDYVAFRRIDGTGAARAIRSLMADAGLVKSCKADLGGTACNADQLLSWVLVPRDGLDDETNAAAELQRRALAVRLMDAFWQIPAQKESRPHFGFGASVTISAQDYAWNQGKLDPVADADRPGFVKLRLDPAVPLVAGKDSHTNSRFEGRAFYYAMFDDTAEQLARPGTLPGIMFLGSVARTLDWRYRPGVEGLTICPAPSAIASAAAITQCAARTVDAPVRTVQWSAALELRTELRNIPYVGTVGLAPRLEVAFENGRKVADFPIYLKLGSTTGGIRLRQAFDGRDLLGNPMDDETTLSLFFTPLTFTRF